MNQTHGRSYHHAHPSRNDRSVPYQRLLAEDRERGKDNADFEENFADFQTQRLLAFHIALGLELPGLLLNLGSLLVV